MKIPRLAEKFSFNIYSCQIIIYFNFNQFITLLISYVKIRKDKLKRPLSYIEFFKKLIIKYHISREVSVSLPCQVEVLEKEKSTTKLKVRLVCSVKNWAKKHESEYRIVFENELIPIVVIEESGNIEYKKNILGADSYLACLKNVTVIGFSSMIYDELKYVISDNLSHQEYGNSIDLYDEKQVIHAYSKSLLVRLPEIHDEIEEVFMLCGYGTSEYGHWFAEYMPKLFIFEKHSEFEKIPILVDENMPDSHYDFLRAIVSNKVIKIKKGQRLSVASLWVAPTTTFRPFHLKKNHSVPVEHCGALSPRVLRFFQAKVLSRYNDNVKVDMRIYLARGRRSWRKLINENELIDALREYGFMIVYPEDLSFDEQVNLFRRAKIIVAPNGSAINNIIYSTVNVEVIVIQTPGYDWRTGIGPLMELKYKIRQIFGISDTNTNNKHDDFTVNVDEVIDLLRSIDKR